MEDPVNPDVLSIDLRRMVVSVQYFLQDETVERDDRWPAILYILMIVRTICYH